ncbi:MAG TPA: hypothetical protein PLN48_00760 [Lachnospiraceae bacterium]|nr:hypothetical protein [Lachnospiraceae bacterium]
MKKGSKGVKIMSILFIIFSIIGVITIGVEIAGLGALAVSGGATTGEVAAFSGFVFGLAIVSAILELIAGIIGVKNYTNPAKMKPVIVCTVIFMVIDLIYVFAQSSGTQGSMGIYVASAILSVILPVLMLIFAFQLKKDQPAA